ncbi:hypothetical protein GYMLUDRAFT_58854 [Collybiopsis luxurians FD-317 M1]|uniref:Uncharacterized protein n=1 Tax=Collybiopsis luxurians FD-317 M1 TaxID=944289 RepID=A0A0D0CY79_9AGAR|nr:hypothetical protein GYMLUDRAFT_58854 [Collybiopsis luxurians FD-317 M1]
MKDINYDSSFIPEGGPSHATFNTLTVAAGVQWHNPYNAAGANEQIIVGGISPAGSVGTAGGWVQGGGHGIFSPQFRIGMDNAVQFTIITSFGLHLTANAYSYLDFFWVFIVHGPIWSVKAHSSFSLTAYM